MVEKAAGFDKSTIYKKICGALDGEVELFVLPSRRISRFPVVCHTLLFSIEDPPMLDTTPTDSPTCPDDNMDGIPHTLFEAHLAWENARQRNLEIRRRFQEGREKGVLLRSAAMLPSWQT